MVIKTLHLTLCVSDPISGLSFLNLLNKDRQEKEDQKSIKLLTIRLLKTLVLLNYPINLKN